MIWPFKKKSKSVITAVTGPRWYYQRGLVGPTPVCYELKAQLHRDVLLPVRNPIFYEVEDALGLRERDPWLLG